jgi:hypothetical protein
MPTQRPLEADRRRVRNVERIPFTIEPETRKPNNRWAPARGRPALDKGRNMNATLSPNIRELAHRRSANLEVTLLWNRLSHRVWISIYDVASDEQTAAVVPEDRALDAFNHPYAYVAA